MARGDHLDPGRVARHTLRLGVVEQVVALWVPVRSSLRKRAARIQNAQAGKASARTAKVRMRHVSTTAPR